MLNQKPTQLFNTGKNVKMTTLKQIREAHTSREMGSLA